jgi:hypothetical protein
VENRATTIFHLMLPIVSLKRTIIPSGERLAVSGLPCLPCAAGLDQALPRGRG